MGETERNRRTEKSFKMRKQGRPTERGDKMKQTRGQSVRVGKKRKKRLREHSVMQYKSERQLQQLRFPTVKGEHLFINVTCSIEGHAATG